MRYRIMSEFGKESTDKVVAPTNDAGHQSDSESSQGNGHPTGLRPLYIPLSSIGGRSDDEEPPHGGISSPSAYPPGNAGLSNPQITSPGASSFASYNSGSSSGAPSFIGYTPGAGSSRSGLCSPSASSFGNHPGISSPLGYSPGASSTGNIPSPSFTGDAYLDASGRNRSASPVSRDRSSCVRDESPNESRLEIDPFFEKENCLLTSKYRL